MQKRRIGKTLLVVAALLSACRAPEVEGPIALEKIGRVTGPAEDGGFEGLALLSAPFSDGSRIAIVPWLSSPRPVLVVDPDGTVRDTLATNGEGPGQVAHPEWVIRGSGDTIIVLDRYRLHFFAPNRRYIRSIPSPLGGSWSAGQGPDGTVVLASNAVGGPETIVVGVSPADGSRRFAILAPPFDAGAVPENRFVAFARDGTWWTVRAWGRYELQHYSTDGRLLRTIPMTADWYPPRERWSNTSANHAPNTDVTGFWIDSLGRGWVMAQTADPHWASAEGETIRSEGQEIFMPKHGNQVRDGIIEVVDLDKGKAIATWRRDQVFGNMAEPGVLYEWRFGEEGWAQIDLYRVVPHF